MMLVACARETPRKSEKLCKFPHLADLSGRNKSFARGLRDVVGQIETNDRSEERLQALQFANERPQRLN
jgi:hypothetical protein